jgi:hypothetical protein
MTNPLPILPALLAVLTAAPPPTIDPEARLVAAGLLKASDRSQLDKGGIVTKMLEVPNKSEVRTLVLLRVGASEAQFRSCIRDPQCKRRPGDLVASGILSEHPSVNELKDVTLDKKELSYLSRCRISSCDFRLSADDIERFRGEIGWKAPDSEAKADSLIREILARYATSYLRQGDRVLPTYSNNPHPLRVQDSLHDLFGSSLPVVDQVPELLRYVEDFPDGSLKPAEEILSWYKERVWRESVIALNHVVLYDRSDGDAERVFVVSKQLFASNYYDSSVEVTEFYRRTGSDQATLVFLSAARMDVGRPEGFNFLERLLLHHFIPRGLNNWVTALRDRMKGVGAPATAAQLGP